MSSDPLAQAVVQQAELQESERVELKKSLAEQKEGLVSIAAILNKHGQGELWFGVAPNGTALGLDVTEKTLRDLSQAIAAHIEPKIYPQVSAQTIGSKTCIHVRFSGTDAPYFAHGRAWMRVADEDRQLSAKALQNLILDKHRQALHWDNQPCDLPVDALDPAKVRRFVERAGLQWDGDLANALTKLDLMRDGRLLNAARLFFARAAPIQLRCAVFANTNSATILDRHDFDGDLLELIDEAQKYILKNIHIGMRLDGLVRVDVPEVSTAALREAVINAFCHRDWRDADYIHVAVFKDRVEIRNPGNLMDGLTIEAIRQGNVSLRRNPLIADLLRRIQMIEAWGRGMPLMLENAPTAQFRQIGPLFIASFERPSGGAGEAPESAQNPRETPDKPQRNPREKLLDLVKAQPELTIPAMAEATGLSVHSVQHHLNVMKAEGQIRRVGARKTGRWEIVDTANTGE